MPSINKLKKLLLTHWTMVRKSKYWVRQENDNNSLKCQHITSWLMQSWRLTPLGTFCGHGYSIAQLYCTLLLYINRNGKWYTNIESEWDWVTQYKNRILFGSYDTVLHVYIIALGRLYITGRWDCSMCLFHVHAYWPSIDYIYELNISKIMCYLQTIWLSTILMCQVLFPFFLTTPPPLPPPEIHSLLLLPGGLPIPLSLLHSGIPTGWSSWLVYCM